MSSVKRWVAAAGQHPAPNSGFVKTTRTFYAVLAGIVLYLIATKIFSGRLITIQPVVCKPDSLRTDERISLRVVGKPTFLRCIRKLDCWDISSNTQQFQPPVDCASVISPIQGKSIHWNAKFDLPLQMPQDQEAFLLVGRIYVNACQNAVFAVRGCFHQITNASLVAMVDVAAVRIYPAGGTALFYGPCRRLFESRLLGKFFIQRVEIALHALFYFCFYIDPAFS